MQQCHDAMVGEPESGDAGAGIGDDRVGGGDESLVASGRVVTESLDVQETPIGGEADLAERRQVGQSFPDLEVAGVVDGGLSS
jgi:hypothetical protein